MDRGIDVAPQAYLRAAQFTPEGQLSGCAASIRLVAAAGMSCTAIVRVDRRVIVPQHVYMAVARIDESHPLRVEMRRAGGIITFFSVIEATRRALGQAGETGQAVLTASVPVADETGGLTSWCQCR